MSERALDLKRRLRDGATALGAWLSIADPAVAEIMAGAGFDYILIDTEHAPWSLDRCRPRCSRSAACRPCRSCACPGTTRSTSSRRSTSAPTACSRRWCAARRSARPGRRGQISAGRHPRFRAAPGVRLRPQHRRLCGGRERGDDRDPADRGRRRGRSDRRDPGRARVNALCIGPNDLSGSAGVLRQHDHPVVRGAIDRILKAASARGVAVCTGVTLPLEQQHDWIARGARLALLTSDVELLAGGAARLAAARAALAR